MDAADIERRIEAKQADYETAAGKLADVRARLIDATDGQRAKLLQERMLIVADRDALADEVRELKRRYALAAIAPYETAEADAAAFAALCYERETAARRALNAALDDYRHWLNDRTAAATTEEHDKQEAAWAGRLATLRAESQIAHDATWKAGHARERAHNETAAMRQHLGIA